MHLILLLLKWHLAEIERAMEKKKYCREEKKCHPQIIIVTEITRLGIVVLTRIFALFENEQ